VLAGFCSLAAVAGTRKVDCVQLLIQGGSEELVIEIPVLVLETLQARSPASLEVGTVSGTEIQAPCDALLEAVRDRKAKSGDGVTVMTVDTRQGPLSLAVRRVERKVADAEGASSELVYVKSDKGSKVTLKVTFDSISQFAGNFAGEADPDLGPFIRACLSVAGDIGPGPLLRIVDGDVEQGFYLE
jgi:hypothetical protein